MSRGSMALITARSALQDMKREHEAALRSIKKLGSGLAALEAFLPIQPRDGNDSKSWDICQEDLGLKAQIAQCNALLEEFIRSGQRQTHDLPQLIPGTCKHLE